MAFPKSKITVTASKKKAGNRTRTDDLLITNSLAE
jgi:hypothetical protein